ncbi:nucleotide exchange factor GrpE [Brumicola nitratireducens]|jgi:molecular chaperone GrpE|uniref:Protein GrpE n=1 Tax=Glaciecola nitratireducens (strain JCM 12485 / KCTC 12276 / FR1064) TaxID=1085623 RepID=G4QHQ0_GLANF|nr:nucleotide exchange factor GrpE [Glaciecola nitratireducens]AEP30277.1 heat shock protein GrpE [Glaciecola nitratireducens FR1064]
MSDEQNKPVNEHVVEGELVNDDEQPMTADELEQAMNEDENVARIAQLEAALEVANSTIEGQKDAVLRARADMENARRRAEQEVDKARKFALERFAGELLPVLDNLERAIQVADVENEAIKPVIEGVDLTLKSFISIVEKFGMEIVDPQGETFNPELHQAMSMQETTEFAPNSVMAVMQKGYTLNGRLLRPAMVMVSRAASGGVDTQV